MQDSHYTADTLLRQREFDASYMAALACGKLGHATPAVHWRMPARRPQTWRPGF